MDATTRVFPRVSTPAVSLHLSPSVISLYDFRRMAALAAQVAPYTHHSPLTHPIFTSAVSVLLNCAVCRLVSFVWPHDDIHHAHLSLDHVLIFPVCVRARWYTRGRGCEQASQASQASQATLIVGRC